MSPFSRYWNLTGNRDFGDWLRTGGYNSTDKGVVPLTSLNDINGRRIDGWYNGSRLNGQQSCSLIQNSGTDNEFVYVNRTSECSSYENAGFYRDIDAYIPFFPSATVLGDTLTRRMPNATGRTNHAAPEEDFADSLAHFINLGPSDMRSSNRLGLGDNDPRVRFIEDNFCSWIQTLIERNP